MAYKSLYFSCLIAAFLLLILSKPSYAGKCETCSSELPNDSPFIQCEMCLRKRHETVECGLQNLPFPVETTDKSDSSYPTPKTEEEQTLDALKNSLSMCGWEKYTPIEQHRLMLHEEYRRSDALIKILSHQVQEISCYGITQITTTNIEDLTSQIEYKLHRKQNVFLRIRNQNGSFIKQGVMIYLSDEHSVIFMIEATPYKASYSQLTACTNGTISQILQLKSFGSQLVFEAYIVEEGAQHSLQENLKTLELDKLKRQHHTNQEDPLSDALQAMEITNSSGQVSVDSTSHIHQEHTSPEKIIFDTIHAILQENICASTEINTRVSNTLIMHQILAPWLYSQLITNGNIFDLQNIGVTLAFTSALSSTLVAESPLQSLCNEDSTSNDIFFIFSSTTANEFFFYHFILKMKTTSYIYFSNKEYLR